MDEPKTLASRTESAICAAADAHLTPMTLAVMYAFIQGKKAYKKGGATAAVKAVREGLLKSLPSVLLKALVAGGEAGLGLLPKRRAAEWDEEKHPRGPGGKFGAGPAHAAEAIKGEKRSGDDFLKSPEQKIWEKSVSKEDRAVIADYTQDTVLSDDPHYTEYTQTRDKVEQIVANAPKFEGTVWRGSISNTFEGAKPGDVITMSHIDSASRDPKIATNFLSSSGTSLSELNPATGKYEWHDSVTDKWSKKIEVNQGTLLKIDVKSGAAIERFSAVHEDAGNEREVIIPKGRYEVVHASHEGNFHFIHLKELSQRGLSSAAEFRTLKPKSPIGIAFDVTSPEAIAWAREHAGELAKDISDTTEQNIKDAIAKGLEGGGLDAIYDDILDAIGDETRAEMIARTETMDAANEGLAQSWDQAREAGLLSADAKKQWIATASGACPECEEVDGEEVLLDEDFSVGDDPPLHPNCRCTMGLSLGGEE